MNKRMMALLLAAALTVGAVASCGKKGGTEDFGANGGKVSSAESEAGSSNQNPANTTIADDIFSYQIGLEGVVYTVPCKVTDLTDNGWYCTEGDPIEAGKNDTMVIFSHGGVMQIACTVTNHTSDTIARKDGIITNLHAEVKDDMTVTLPGHFVFSATTTVEDIIAQYGEPVKQDDLDNFIMLYYVTQYDKEIRFAIYKKNSDYTMNDSVTIRNTEYAEGETSQESAEVENVNISDRLDSFQFSLDGHLYTLPTTYDEFEQNGWKLWKEEANRPVESRYYGSAEYLRKGDQEISICVVNTSGETLNYVDCPLFEVDMQPYCCKSIILPGQLVFDKNTTEQDVIAKYGQPTTRSETDDSVTLRYDFDVHQFARFSFAKPESDISPEYNHVRFFCIK